MGVLAVVGYIQDADLTKLARSEHNGRPRLESIAQILFFSSYFNSRKHRQASADNVRCSVRRKAIGVSQTFETVIKYALIVA